MVREAALAGALVAATLLGACSQSADDMLAARWQMLDAYCTDCHNAGEVAGGLSLEGAEPSVVAAHPETWEFVVRKLRTKVMPPPGSARPDNDQVDELVAALESTLDAAARSSGPAPGYVVLHRLNRSEYETAVENLLGVSIDGARLLPPDATSEGFDNVANVLGVSPTYLDQYIAAAREISIKAVGDSDAAPVRANYRIDNRNRTAHVDGLPLGTRDGVVIEHYFPADGEYVFTLDVSSEPGAELRAYPQGWLEYRHRGILTIDGARVFDGELGGEEDLRRMDQEQIAAVGEIRARFQDIRVPVSAGYHAVGAAFVARSYAESDFLLQRFVPGEGLPDVPQMLGMTIVGPYDASGISATRTRDRIFVCYPEIAEDELPCATKILANLARVAFRRPITESDLDPLLAFFEAGRQSGGFEVGIQKGLLAILSSTKFLYRGALGDEPPHAGQVSWLTDLDLATRLAFFLWSRGPDEELLTLAESGRLGEPDVYEAQVRRLLEDPRSIALVRNFAFQWLGVRLLETTLPDERLYPYFDGELRDAFEHEMELFLDSILRSEDRSVVELLTARHTFVNERLARHYGIEDVRGDRFRRVELEDPERWGLLGKGSVLTTTSYPDRTSPVLRGAWVMEQLLGIPPTPPPPGVETNLVQVSQEAPRSVRERLELHRNVQSCNHCHGVIDPLGQALEHYNAIGEWRERERDSGVPIDPTGQLAGGRQVSSPSDLREALTEDPDLFVQTVTEKLMTYGLGRTVEYFDMPTVRSIVRASADDNHAFASLVLGVATSDAFRMRAVPEPRIDDGIDETVAAAARDE